MKLSQITPKNIKAFIEGYSKLAYDKLVGLPIHLQEQILYRESKCQDCVTVGHKDVGPGSCKHCGCSTPGKWFVTKSCNGGERYPDLMGSEEWKKFKLDNNIDDSKLQKTE